MSARKPAKKKKLPSRIYFQPRPTECSLLIISSILVIYTFSGCFFLGNRSDYLSWVLPVAFLCAVWLAHLIGVIFPTNADETILPVISILIGFGLSYQYRLGQLSTSNIQDPRFWIPGSVPAVIMMIAILFQKDRLKYLDIIRSVLIGLVIALPAYIILEGVNYRGSLYGPAKTTPTEFLKPVFVIIFAGYLARHGKYLNKGNKLLSKTSMIFHFKLLCIWGIPQILFIIQKDLGMVLITTLLLIVMLFYATKRWIYIVGSFLGTVLGAYLFKTFIRLGRVRFEAWLDPFHHPADSGYQIIQALFALFHGEMLGRGFHGGFPEKIPLVTSDFIYASMAEELGLIGSVLILAGFMYIAFRGYQKAGKVQLPLLQMTAVGCATLICIQVLLNVGGVIKLIPMTGVPLPFISIGSSAGLAFAIIVGWILAVEDS